MNENASRISTGAGERVTSVIAEDFMQQHNSNAIRLTDLLSILRIGKWLLAGVTTIFMLAAGAYVTIATEWYRADVLLIPASSDLLQSASQFSALGGLASLAGIGGARQKDAEAVAVLQSRSFIGAFINQYDLMPVLLASRWDSAHKRWKSISGADAPDIRDAVRYFRKNVINVSEDDRTQLVTLSIYWTDPKTAATWANALVARLNRDMQQRALARSEANVNYLKHQLSQVNLTALQQSIGSLLEAQLRNAMLASGDKEFAFRVIDSAEVPKKPAKPRRALIMAVSFVLGIIVSFSWIFARYALAKEGTVSPSGQ